MSLSHFLAFLTNFSNWYHNRQSHTARNNKTDYILLLHFKFWNFKVREAVVFATHRCLIILKGTKALLLRQQQANPVTQAALGSVMKPVWVCVQCRLRAAETYWESGRCSVGTDCRSFLRCCATWLLPALLGLPAWCPCVFFFFFNFPKCVLQHSD